MTNCCQEELSIKIKFKDPKVYEDFNHIEVGDWIDLRVNDTVSLKAGQFKLLDLGVALELPKGYEAYILPRSSTFKKYGLIQTNGMGM